MTAWCAPRCSTTWTNGKTSPDPAAAAAGEKQSVLIMTPLYADRHDLKQMILKAPD